MLRSASSVTPGISLLPRTRGPIPERKRRSPTLLACGNAPTGSAARELSNDLLINEKAKSNRVTHLEPLNNHQLQATAADCPPERAGLANTETDREGEEKTIPISIAFSPGFSRWSQARIADTIDAASHNP